MNLHLRARLATIAAAASLAAAAPTPAQTAETPAHALPCDGARQDRQACLRERASAAQAARRGDLTSPGEAESRRNALARCERQSPSDRADCEARTLGGGHATIEGSVLGGGLIRSTVTTVPASN